MGARVALVGCGAIAEIICRRGYGGGLADLQLVAAIDPDPVRARLIADLTGARAFADLESAADAVRPDAADIRTPHYSHARVASEALSLGLHVLVEKPAATSLAAARELAQAAADSDLSVSVAENYGLLPSVQSAAEQLRNLAIGELVIARTTRAFGIGPPWLRPWRLAGQQPGSGVVIDQGCHHVRMLRTVVGEIAAVHAFASGRSVNGSAPDTCAVNLTFASGAIGQMLLTWASATPAPGPELQVLGTEGSLEVHVSYDQPGGGCARWRRGDSQPVWDATDADYYDSLDRVIVHWAEVMNGAHSQISLHEATKDMTVTDAIIRALSGGHRGDVPVPAWV